MGVCVVCLWGGAWGWCRRGAGGPGGLSVCCGEGGALSSKWKRDRNAPWPEHKECSAGSSMPCFLPPPLLSSLPLPLPQVAAATQQWDGSGSFVFTSSMSVCATDDGGEVSENCPLVPQGKSPSTDRWGRVVQWFRGCGGLDRCPVFWCWGGLGRLQRWTWA